jgi:hypothetical protein
MNKTTELSKAQTKEESQLVPESNNMVEVLMQQAINNNVPVETIKELMAMRRELKEEAAKEAFHNAMMRFQVECPIIKKSKEGGKTKSGHVAYMYAPIESIIKQVGSLIQKHGFSYRFDESETEDGTVKAVCIVTHRDGHSETSSLKSKLSTKTSVMSDPQQKAATLTYNKRYAFCNAFGISTGDDDIDGQDLVQQIQEPQYDLKELQTKIEAAKDMHDLKTIWVSIPAQAQKQLVIVKDAVKYKFELKLKQPVEVDVVPAPKEETPVAKAMREAREKAQSKS